MDLSKLIPESKFVELLNEGCMTKSLPSRIKFLEYYAKLKNIESTPIREIKVTFDPTLLPEEDWNKEAEQFPDIDKDNITKLLDTIESDVPF